MYKLHDLHIYQSVTLNVSSLRPSYFDAYYLDCKKS